VVLIDPVPENNFATRFPQIQTSIRMTDCKMFCRSMLTPDMENANDKDHVDRHRLVPLRCRTGRPQRSNAPGMRAGRSQILQFGDPFRLEAARLHAGASPRTFQSVPHRYREETMKR
jgi:hypothetical protein